MAKDEKDKKISELEKLEKISGDELIPVAKNDDNYSITPQQIREGLATTDDLAWNKESNDAVWQVGNRYASSEKGQLGGSSVSENLSIATGHGAHAEGANCVASGARSHAEGEDTVAQNDAEHAQGRFNLSIQGETIHTVGNGRASSLRHNAHQIMADGTHYIPDIHAEGQFYEKPMINLQDTLKDLQNNKLGKTEASKTYATVQSVSDSLNSFASSYNAMLSNTNSQVSSNMNYVMTTITTKFGPVGNLRTYTQAEYDNLETKENNTLYFIIEE